MIQEKVNFKNPGVGRMLTFLGEIKGVICMSSEKISKNLTTGFVCKGEPGCWGTREERQFIFILIPFITFEF